MVAFAGFVKPTNKVIVMGKPELQEYTAEESGIKPGMVIMSGTTQDLCKIATTSVSPKQPIGFAGYEQSYQGGFDSTSIYTKNRPEGITVAYAINAKIPVLFGGNFVILSKMQAGSAAVKGDQLACIKGGELVAGREVAGGFAIRVPFTQNATEVSTGLVLPAGAVINDVFIEVTTNVGGSSIDVGLAEVTGAETGGDADGFLDGESCVTAGRVQHSDGNTAAASNTLGAFLAKTDLKDNNTTPLYWSLPKKHVCDGVAKTVTYTTSAHAVAGYIYVVVEGVEKIAKAVETVTAGAAVMVQALI